MPSLVGHAPAASAQLGRAGRAPAAASRSEPVRARSHPAPTLRAQLATEGSLFIWLIIRFIRLIFLIGTVFFSHKKSVNSVFQPAYNSSQTVPLSLKVEYIVHCTLPSFSARRQCKAWAAEPWALRTYACTSSYSVDSYGPSSGSDW
jgi:hypothetical protein